MTRWRRMTAVAAFGATVAMLGCRGGGQQEAQQQTNEQQTWGSGARNDGATRSDATSRSGTGGSGITGMGSTEQMDSNSAQGQAQPPPKQNPAENAESR